MVRYARSKGRLNELAAVIEATARLDPYPRLMRFMQRSAAPAPDPYPRLARAMRHLAARQLAPYGRGLPA
jgi:hypothetical protein